MIDGLVSLLTTQNFTGIGTRVFEDTIPQHITTRPAVVCSEIDPEPYESLDGSHDLESMIVDVDVYAKTPGDARTPAKLIKAFLRNYTGAMGDHQCKAVIYQGSVGGYIRTSKGDAGDFIRTLSFQIQFIEA